MERGKSPTCASLEGFGKCKVGASHSHKKLRANKGN